MHSAPPVLVPVGRFVWGHACAWGMAVLVALFLGATWFTSSASTGQGLVWLALWLLAGLLCWWLALRETLPAGSLAWDGEAWTYLANGESQSDPSEPVLVQVLWDAGSAMLVGVRTQAAAGSTEGKGQRFAWLRAAHMPAPAPSHWHAWRCAVYAHDIL